MLAFITVIGNREHDQDGDSVMNVYIVPSPASNVLDTAGLLNTAVLDTAQWNCKGRGFDFHWSIMPVIYSYTSVYMGKTKIKIL